MDRCIIAISHSNYRIKSAGIEKFIQETSLQIMRSGLHILQVFPVIEINKVLRKQYVAVNYDGVFNGIYREDYLYSALNNICDNKNIEYVGIDIHQLHGWNLKNLTSVILELNVPVNFYVHDYATVSSKVLADTNQYVQRYPISCFGEADIKKFEEFENFFSAIFVQVKKVVAPSLIAGENWCKSYPSFRDKLVIRKHLSCSGSRVMAKNISQPIRIGYLGSTASHKGFAYWEKLVALLGESQDYSFYYFGRDTRAMPGVKKVQVDFHNKDSKSMTECILQEKIDVVFLWSTWQETYCYTYYEAAAAGCYVLTNAKSGNIQFQVKANDDGKVFDSFDDCLDYLNNLAQIKKDVSEFQSRRDVPAYVPNPNIADLIPGTEMREKRNICKKTCKSYILSFVYRVLRGNYK